MDLTKFLERAAGQVKPVFSPRTRLAMEAETLDQAGDLASHLIIVKMRLAVFIDMLYKRDGNRFVNIDNETQLIKIVKPWGSTGWRKWSLRRWEATCLRQILIEQSQNPGPKLFFFNDLSCQWYLNTIGYPTQEKAFVWLDTAIDADQWAATVDDYRRQSMEYMQQYREKRR